MSTIAQGSAEAAGVSRQRTWRVNWAAVLAAALLLTWAVHGVASWAGGYQRVPMSSLQHEIAVGEVTGYALVSDPPGSDTTPWWQITRPEQTVDTAPGADTDSAMQDPLASGMWSVVYTVQNGRPRVAEPGFGQHGPPLTSFGGPSEEEGRWVRTELLTSDVPRLDPGQLDLGRAGQVTIGSALLLGGAALAHLLFGPRPRRGTRWFWFWVLGVTGGVGAVAYALYEIGGRRADRAPLEEDRPGGWAGFGWLLFLTMAVGILAQLTLALVGATVTPL